MFEQCSYDYDKNSQTTRDFYAFVQNRLYFAITGKTEYDHDFYATLSDLAVKYVQEIGRKYPNCGFGGMFSHIGTYWLNDLDSDTEIDVMAVDNQHKLLFAEECKSHKVGGCHRIFCLERESKGFHRNPEGV